MFSILAESLQQPTIILTILFLLATGWLMERIISRMPLMCRSVHVVHVPWGILVVTLLTYLNGYIDYKAVIIMALFYLVSYPSMWFLNYQFSRNLEEILRKKHVTQETSERLVWPEEVKWIYQIRSRIKDDKVVSRIMDNDKYNGNNHHYSIPIPTKRTDN